MLGWKEKKPRLRARRKVGKKKAKKNGRCGPITRKVLTGRKTTSRVQTANKGEVFLKNRRRESSQAAGRGGGKTENAATASGTEWTSGVGKKRTQHVKKKHSTNASGAEHGGRGPNGSSPRNNNPSPWKKIKGGQSSFLGWFFFWGVELGTDRKLGTKTLGWQTKAQAHSPTQQGCLDLCFTVVDSHCRL